MTIDEAKSILHGYRPTGADANDPIFHEALALARHDPALGQWFAQQQAFDAAMMSGYDAVPAPAGLRDGILAAVTAAATPAPDATHQSWWRRRSSIGLAAAASIAVLFSVGLALRPKPKLPASQSPLADFVVQDAQHPKTHGGHGEETAELNRTLKLPTTKLGQPLKLDFATLHDTGCRTLNVEGRNVLEVCFKRNGVGLHCYIARLNDFPTLTAPAKPEIAEKPEACIASWSDATNLYLVVTAPDRAALEKLL